MTTKTDYDLITEWLEQEPPQAAELSESDVWAAYVAHDVLTNYHEPRTNYQVFDIGHTMAGVEAEVAGWKATMQTVKRGIAVLNGYLLTTNARVPVWEEAPTDEDAIVSRRISGGYRATEEMHRTMSLVAADDLITLSAATQIMFGEVTQSKRVMLKEDINYGYLQVFFDRKEQNPQKAQRVSRRDVLRLKMQRSHG